MEGGKVANTNTTFKDYFKEKIDGIKEVKTRKRKLIEEL